LFAASKHGSEDFGNFGALPKPDALKSQLKSEYILI
jgi:hypothetical protein